MPLILTSSVDLGPTCAGSRIQDHLARWYGEDIDFVEREADLLARSVKITLASVLIVIVGPAWIAPESNGSRPLDNEDDPIRFDIRTAFELGLPVVLVLIDGAVWPNPQELPPRLREPAFEQIIEVHNDDDLDQLVRTLDETKVNLRFLEDSSCRLLLRENIVVIDQSALKNIEEPAPPEDGGAGATPSPQPLKMKDATEAALSAIRESRSVPDTEPSGTTVDSPVAAKPANESMSERAWPGLRSSKSAKAICAAPHFDDEARRHTETIRHRASDEPESVEFGVAHPAAVSRDLPFLVDVWVFRPDDRSGATSIAMRQRPGSSQFRTGSSASVQTGSRLTVQLQIQPWNVEPDVQILVWTGEIASVSFRVTPDVGLQADSVIGDCKIFMNGLRIGQIFFELSLASRTSDTQFEKSKIISTAFASYAAKDRSRVLARVQGIEKVGVRVFIDVRDLKSGAHYPTQLFSQIDCSDVLYLFWSRHAKNSEWVALEWRYGLVRKGIEFIDPVPLTDPRKVTPPPELSGEKHFNDWTLAYLEYENSLGLWHRFRRLLTNN
jgi:hypothetical protein